MASEGLRYTSNVRASRNLTGDSRASSLTCLQPWHRPSRRGYLGEDGTQAISEVSEDTTTTIVNVSSGYGIGALRGPGDRFEDEVCVDEYPLFKIKRDGEFYTSS